MNTISSVFLLCFLIPAITGSSQVTFVDKNQSQALKNAGQTLVILASENPRTIKKLSKKKNPEYLAMYKGMVNEFNTSLREIFAAEWKFNAVQFKSKSDLAAMKMSGASDAKIYIIACAGIDEMLAEAAEFSAKKKKTIFDLDEYLIRRDEASSLDILPMSQSDDYFLSKSAWDLRQEKKMENDKRVGKTTQPGDYLRHKLLEFTGFYLSQHAILTKSDLKFALFYLQQDLEKAAMGGKKIEVNKAPELAKSDLAQKTLLIGRDLVNFPNGKVNLTEADIRANYPHPFKIVGQSEIEKVFAEKNNSNLVIVPCVRWSPTGYPELLLFYVVDAADGKSIVSFADTGSGSNPMTANQFERSQEMKGKHFGEIVERAGE